MTGALRVEGRRVAIEDGDTIASAMFRDGVRTFTRSLKYHRRRGLYCLTRRLPELPRHRRRAAGRARVRDRRRARASDVDRVSGWPSTEHDALHVTDRLHRLMPVGVLLEDVHPAAVRVAARRARDPPGDGHRPPAGRVRRRREAGARRARRRAGRGRRGRRPRGRGRGGDRGCRDVARRGARARIAAHRTPACATRIDALGAEARAAGVDDPRTPHGRRPLRRAVRAGGRPRRGPARRGRPRDRGDRRRRDPRRLPRQRPARRVARAGRRAAGRRPRRGPRAPRGGRHVDRGGRRRGRDPARGRHRGRGGRPGRRRRARRGEPPRRGRGDRVRRGPAQASRATRSCCPSAGRRATTCCGWAPRTRSSAPATSSCPGARSRRPRRAGGERPAASGRRTPPRRHRRLGEDGYVCLCEDVAVHDLEQAWDEGWRSLGDPQALHDRHDGPLPGRGVRAAARGVRRGPGGRADAARDTHHRAPARAAHRPRGPGGRRPRGDRAADRAARSTCSSSARGWSDPVRGCARRRYGDTRRARSAPSASASASWTSGRSGSSSSPGATPASSSTACSRPGRRAICRRAARATCWRSTRPGTSIDDGAARGADGRHVHLTSTSGGADRMEAWLRDWTDRLGPARAPREPDRGARCDRVAGPHARDLSSSA